MKKIEQLINKNKYQIFLFKCPANLPFSFAVHTWFVCNKKGEISRWEVLFRKNKDKKFGHIHLNRYSPYSGIEVFPFFFHKIFLERKFD